MNHRLLPLLCALLLTPATALFAQMGLNAPTGLAPRQDMEIYTRNGFLVQQKYTFTTADPNASINTMRCAASPVTLTAPAGILKDPGGDSNYPASMTCTQTVFHDISVSGYEVIFEDLDTEANQDLVIITDLNSNTLAFSGTSLPAPFFVAGNQFTVRFQANNNGTVGRGFRLRWRGVLQDVSTPTTPNTAFGNALQFDANKGALLGGYLTIGALQRAGQYSTALGFLNTASGSTSSALGYGNTASGSISSALGYGNTASGNNSSALGDLNKTSGNNSSALGSFNTVSGDYSSALGSGNTADGDNSSALGSVNTASGNASFALGYGNTASGAFSTALGVQASTGSFQGSMALGDYPSFSPPAALTNTASTAANQLTARFSGGYRFISGYNASTGTSIVGAILAPGGNSWAAISDSTKKERFWPINHTEVLGKLSTLKLGSWNYKGQPGQRHYGPMAQDFYARFGHDGIGVIGCDTLLAGHDFTAITLAGVQALIRENEALKAKLAQTEAKLNQVESQANTKLEQANARLEALEGAVFVRRRGRALTRK